MPLVVTQEGANQFTKIALGAINAPSLLLRLIGIGHAVSHTDTAQSLEGVELPQTAGYLPLILSPPTNWVLSPIAPGIQAVYPAQQWTFTNQLTVYGYFITDVGGSVSYWGENFPTAFVYNVGGGVFQLQPAFSLTSQP